MPNENYIAGRNGEYHIRNCLRSLGYAAERSAGSHGPWDVAAVGPGDVVLVQAKKGGKPSPSDYQGIVDLPVAPGVIKMVVWIPPAMSAARVLYCNIAPIPEWCGRIRWLAGPPPKQTRFRGL
jgi:hypothetical protein